MGDEISAMKTVNDALAELAPDEVARVLRWAVDKYRATVREVGEDLADPDERENQAVENGSTPAGVPEAFESFADLFDAAQPKSAADNALVGTYWFQKLQGEADVTGQQVNTELKHLGHGTTNITDSFDKLMNQTPKLAMQVRKTGTSRQARKRYKITLEGERRVQRMLAGGGE